MRINNLLRKGKNKKWKGEFDDREIASIIYGRVDPHIYAFKTNTIPNYLKVGDTGRPLELRLDEWREKYPDLKPVYERRALVEENVYFRDYSVHDYLENKLGKKRITKNDIGEGVYYSNEFFKDTKKKDVERAVQDICNKYRKGSLRYDYYATEGTLIETGKREGPYKLRDNQRAVVENFKRANSKGEKNLLLYAAMRFGKSFTSLCCDEKARVIYVVSAKASDVKAEWRQTVSGIENFKNYYFITEKELRSNGDKKSLIKSLLKDKEKKVVVYLTLQDLQGEKIKKKHEEIFETKADLLIVDETHFGARAEKYGAVIDGKTERKKDENEDTVEDVNDAIKKLKAKNTLHLSGTPYKILLTSEFNDDSVIGRIKFSDILAEKKKWNEQFQDKIEKQEINPDSGLPYEEWDNPYFGFPEMVRFAFNPNESSRKKMDKLRELGYSCSLSDLLSVDKDGNFKYENEVLELLQAIDGTKSDKNIFGFLNSERIKDGKMCQHIVFVLPLRASCDAMENLLHRKARIFSNLDKYKIINIAGIKGWKKYKRPEIIKEEIEECDSNGQKTITLTVSRMMTGSTVKEWDTLVYLRGGTSPQEYDQATYRIQSQFIQHIKDKTSRRETVIDKKPQTLLVDFDPNRMFQIQLERIKATLKKGERSNDEIRRQLRRELDFSKVLIVNKEKIREITENEVIEAINDYEKRRSIVDEIMSIPIPENIFSDEKLACLLRKQPLLMSDGNFIIPPNRQDGNKDALTIEQKPKDEKRGDNHSPVAEQTNNTLEISKKQFRAYCSKVLFYAFLTDDNVKSLADVASSIAKKNNKELAKNVGILKSDLSIVSNVLPDLYYLDYEIEKINRISNDRTIEPVERIKIALDKIRRISNSEYITPIKICDSMIDEIKDTLAKGGKILDIASKAGEFSFAVYNVLKKAKVEDKYIVNSIYSIPTSPLAYEFTKKMYNSLGLNTNNIAKKFTSYDIIKKEPKELEKILCGKRDFSSIGLDDNITENGGEIVKFDAVVGNPPYQGENHRQIYPDFYLGSRQIGNNVILIFPTGWQEPKNANNLSKLNKKAIKEDSQIVFIDNRHNVFQGIAGAEWTNIILWKSGYDNGLNGKQKVLVDGEEEKIIKLPYEKEQIVKPEQIIKLAKIVHDSGNFTSLQLKTSVRKPYGLSTDVFKDYKKYNLAPLFSEQHSQDDIKIYAISASTLYVPKNYSFPKKTDAFQSYKVFVPYAWGNMSEKTGLGGAYSDIVIGSPNEACTETYLESGKFDSLEMAKKHGKYLMTRFVRALLYLNKTSHHSTTAWGAVPVQDYSEQWWDKTIDEIDEELFKKYNIPNDVKKFVYDNIQRRTEDNIINFKLEQ